MHSHWPESNQALDKEGHTMNSTSIRRGFVGRRPEALGIINGVIWSAHGRRKETIMGRRNEQQNHHHESMPSRRNDAG